MPSQNGTEPEVREPRNWSEWREETSALLNELDRSLAQARQAIYRLRPIVRPKSEQPDDQTQKQERPAHVQRRRPSRQ